MKEEKAANKIQYNKHKKRKNNDLVAAMYAMYQGGVSLEKIAGVYKKTRQSVYDVFRSRGYELRSKQMHGLKIINGINFTTTKGGYLRGTVPGKGRIMAHRYLWEKRNGKIPEGCVVHHIDGNPQNNNLVNLELCTANNHKLSYSEGYKRGFEDGRKYSQSAVRLNYAGN